MFLPDRGPILIERRTSRRSRATCAACLQTLTSEEFGELWDISQTGARISIVHPPAAGETAILRWANETAMCRVVWSEDTTCGLSFEKPIDAGVVSATARLIGIVEQPVATMGNIPVGQRRSGAVRAPAASDQPERPLLVPRARTQLAADDATKYELSAAEEDFLTPSPVPPSDDPMQGPISPDE